MVKDPELLKVLIVFPDLLVVSTVPPDAENGSGPAAPPPPAPLPNPYLDPVKMGFCLIAKKS
jgi:hypothetical protein